MKEIIQVGHGSTLELDYATFCEPSAEHPCDGCDRPLPLVYIGMGMGEYGCGLCVGCLHTIADTVERSARPTDRPPSSATMRAVQTEKSTGNR